MGQFKIGWPDFGQDSTRVNPTGNPLKHFFLKATQVLYMNQKKNCKIGRMCKKLFSREKCVIILAAPVMFQNIYASIFSEF